MLEQKTHLASHIPNNLSLTIGSIVEYYSQTLTELGEFQCFATQPIKILIEKLPEKFQHILEIAEMPKIIEKTTYENLKLNTPPIKTLAPQKEATAVNSVDLSTIENLDDLREEIEKSCICELKAFATKTVFGDGNPLAKILVIGEAPGQEEDLAGVPFIGRSGDLLMNAFKSIALEREKNFFITNNIFWRPPGNRNPTQEEMDACKPFLAKIIEIINPEAIICIGSVAAQNVLSSEETISNLRNKVFPQAKSLNYIGKIFAIYHPSYLLRNPSKKYEMYKDLLFIKGNLSDSVINL